MKYAAVATDYDETLAWDGQVDEPTVDALNEARAAGLRLILVTGRELTSLFNTFPHSSLFDRIVAENGAIVYDPAQAAIRALAPPPPPGLIARLQQQSIPISVGHSIVSTVEPHEHAVLAAIRDLGIEWHVIFNKGAVMALPAEVTKATGLAVALEELGLTAARTVGIGDAENDQAFLRVCGLSVAVANALPAVKETAHVVTSGSRGAGVTEVLLKLLAGELADRGGAEVAHASTRQDDEDDRWTAG
jgi:hydroxymethylpyrimidine pyrophosphatase-like HAD family hydrolase